MTHSTILYICDEPPSNTLEDALKSAGYDVVITTSPSQAVALLFLMYSAAGVVLSRRVKEHASFDLAHSLGTLCPQIPIILLCDGSVEPAPSTDGCVGTEELVETVRKVLDRNQGTDRRCSSGGLAA
jgi:DNA-binding NtrC family response regulator